MSNKEFICICCPRGCHLSVDENFNVSGNKCLRGKEYGAQEARNPQRTLTSIVRVANRDNVVVSVKTDKPIPKQMIFDVMKILDRVKAYAPLEVGDVLISNVLETGSNIVVTKKVI